MSEVVLGWHFLTQARRLRFGPDVPVVVGETISVDPPLVLCEHGLHASTQIWEALHYAPGLILCRVELSGEIVWGKDKLCAQHRKVLWMADCQKALGDYLFQAVATYLEDCPDLHHWLEPLQQIRTAQTVRDAEEIRRIFPAFSLAEVIHAQTLLYASNPSDAVCVVHLLHVLLEWQTSIWIDSTKICVEIPWLLSKLSFSRRAIPGSPKFETRYFCGGLELALRQLAPEALRDV